MDSTELMNAERWDDDFVDGEAILSGKEATEAEPGALTFEDSDSSSSFGAPSGHASSDESGREGDEGDEGNDPSNSSHDSSDDDDDDFWNPSAPGGLYVAFGMFFIMTFSEARALLLIAETLTQYGVPLLMVLRSSNLFGGAAVTAPEADGPAEAFADHPLRPPPPLAAILGLPSSSYGAPTDPESVEAWLRRLRTDLDTGAPREVLGTCGAFY